MSRLSGNSGSLKLLELAGSVQGCNGITFSFNKLTVSPLIEAKRLVLLKKNAPLDKIPTQR